MYSAICLILLATWITGLVINNLGIYVHVFLAGSIMAFGAQYLGNQDQKTLAELISGKDTTKRAA